MNICFVLVAFFVLQKNGKWGFLGSRAALARHKPGETLRIMDEFDQEIGKRLNAAYWRQQGIDALKDRFKVLTKAGFAPPNKSNRRARNIILFIGDGMGISTVTAARKFKESYTAEPFYKSQMAWDSFPFSGFSKSYMLDNFIAESAGTATAYLTGTKTRHGFIGLDATGDMTCNSTKGQVESIAHWAVRSGKAAGFVTTTTITHASPSPLYAHMPAPLRSYEFIGDKFNFDKTHPSCEDIAKQFVKYGQHIKVAMGGGRAYFTPKSQVPQGDTAFGLRKDGRNLIEDWKADRLNGGAKKLSYVTSREQLQNVDPSVDYLLGLFSYDYMTFVDKHTPSTSSEPSLSEMVKAAINVLNRTEDGYFLFVEGGAIDYGHHLGIARLALTETVEFHSAIETALDLVDLSETLIVVSADHSHTMTIGGYLNHNSSILGLSAVLGSDGKANTVLNYADGTGFNLTGPNGPFSGSRRNVSLAEATSKGFKQFAAVPMGEEGHAGEDLPVYATGVYSELFSGTFEQSYIPWAMACAAGLSGPQDAKQMASICPQPFRRENRERGRISFASRSTNHHQGHGLASVIFLVSAGLFQHVAAY